MGIAALISAASANGKRSAECFGLSEQEIEARNYNNFTKMNPL